MQKINLGIHPHVVLALFAFSIVANNIGAAVQEKSDVNFSEHIAPIIFQNCTTCHRPGEGAPFEFTNYTDIRKRGRLIAKVTGSRFMPPWHAESTEYKCQGSRRLTEKQIATIEKCVETGMADGDLKKLPKLPK